MPKVGQPTATKPACIACGGTETNSKGGPCVPCERGKMVQWLKEPPAKVDISQLFNYAESQQATTEDDRDCR